MDGKLRIEGFREENLTPNGYDLTIGEVEIPGEKVRKRGTVPIPPQTRFLVSTREYVALGPRLVADLWIRSTWARSGLLAAFGKVDAGFEGTLTLGAFNASGEPVSLRIGETFAQMTFHELRSAPTGTYGETSGRYQGQVGVTPARSSGRRRSGPGSKSTP